MADDTAQLPLRYFEMLRHLQDGDAAPQQATVHVDPAAQGLAADRLRALLVRPPAAPDVPLPKQGPLDWFMKAVTMAQGALGINEPTPEEFQTPEDLQQAKRYYGPAAIAGVLLGGPGAMGAVTKTLGAGKEALTGVKAAEEAAPAVKGIKAFHGSGADFDTFDPAFAGSGEGSQYRGVGHNFAEAEPIADEYRKIAGRGQPGHAYEVNIKASPDEFLDWDRPLSQQAPAVTERVRAAVDGKYGPGAFDKLAAKGSDVSDLLGKEGMEALLQKQGVVGTRALDVGSRGAQTADRWTVSNVAADGHPINSLVFPSEAEANAYVTSREYKRQAKQFGYANSHIEMTPAATDLTRNLTVFHGNEHLIEIMRKYGVALPVAAEIYRRQQAQAHEPAAQSPSPFTLSK